MGTGTKCQHNNIYQMWNVLLLPGPLCARDEGTVYSCLGWSVNFIYNTGTEENLAGNT